MKRETILAMVLAMMLCGCNETNSSSAQESKAEKTTATTASQEETVDPETTTSAEETTTESETTEAATTTAADEDGTASDDETATASLNDDLFEGLYYNKSDRSDTLSIDRQNDKLYSVHISRKKTANETIEWYFTGEFNGRQVLNYDNCVKSTMTVGEDGSAMSGTEYTDGKGYIQISEPGDETGLVWHDEKENAGAKDFFVKQ